MRLLLDTHILLWLLLGDERLPLPLHEQLYGAELVISAASIWELSIKHHLGKLPSAGPLLADVEGGCARLGAELLPITHTHALRAGALDWAHRDPFDRVLVAQAVAENLTLVTLDGAIRGYAEARFLPV